MPITVRCPKCQAGYRIPDDKAGRSLRCKKCGAGFTAAERSTDENLVDPWDETVIAPSNLPAPSRQSPAPVRQTKNRKSTASKRSTSAGGTGGGAKVALLVGVGVLSFAIFAVGGYFGVRAILSGINNRPKQPNEPLAVEEAATETPQPPAVAAAVVAPTAAAPAASPANAKRVPAALYVPQSEPVAVEPPPEAEMQALEALSVNALLARMSDMKKEDLGQQGENQGRNLRFSEGSIYRDDAAGFVINESVTRTVTTEGEQTSASWRFEQTTPKYVGTFVAGNFVDPRVSGQAARLNTGEKVRQGVWMLRHDDGALRAQGQYQAGQRQGSFAFWRPDGTRLWQGLYNAGQLDRGANLNADRDSLFGEAATLRHDAPVMAVSFTDDGTRVATGDMQGVVRIWDMQTFSEVAQTRVDDAVARLAFSPAGDILAIGQVSMSNLGEWQLAFWDVAADAPHQATANLPLIADMFFSLNGDTLVTTALQGAEHKLFAWDVKSRSLATAPPVPGSFAISPDRSRVVVHRDDRLALLSGDDLQVIAISDPIQDIQPPINAAGQFSKSFSRILGDFRSQIAFLDESHVLARTNTGIVIWDYEQKTLQSPVELNHLHTNDTVQACSAGRLVEEAHFDYGLVWDGVDKLFNRNEGFPVWNLAERRIEGVLLNPRVLKPYMNTQIASDSARLEAFQFSPDGTFLAARMRRMEFSKDGPDRPEQDPLDMAVWDVVSGRRHVLRGHSAGILQARFSPDSRFLATAGADMSCMLWELEGLRSTATSKVATGNRPPEVALTVHTSSTMLEGHALAAMLQVHDPDGDELTYHYRLGSDGDWRPAWDGWILAYPMPPGDFELQARVVDEHGAEAFTSVPLRVEPNPYARWQLVAEAAFESRYVPTIATSNGKIAAYNLLDSGSLRIWTLPDLRPITLADQHPGSHGQGQVAFSKDGSLIAVTGLRDTDQGLQEISILDGETGTLVGHLPLLGDDPNDQTYVPAVFFNPTGELVSVHLLRHRRGIDTIHDGTTVRIWDPASGEMLREHPFAAATVDGPRLPAGAFQLSPDGRFLAGMRYSEIIGLSLEDGVVTADSSGTTRFAFDANGTRLLIPKNSGHPFRLAVYAVPQSSGEPIAIIESEGPSLDDDGAFVVNPDNQSLLIGQHVVRMSDGRVLRDFIFESTTGFILDGQALVNLAKVDDGYVLQVWGDPASMQSAPEQGAEQVSDRN